VPDAKTEPAAKTPAAAPAKKKKKHTAAAMQRELRDLAKPASEAQQAPPIDLKKTFVRVGLVLGVLWLVALLSLHWSVVPVIVAGVLTVLGVGASIWVVRYVRKARELGALLKAAAETDEGRREAILKLETEYKKGDVQATIARAQLEMQEDPRKALATLESIDLAKQMAPVSDQVRAMRAAIHLQMGELQEARQLVDKMELGKQQEPKTRAMFAAVAAEAWGRTGQGKKAVELLEVFNPDEPDLADMRVQMWRARAFACAGAGDLKAASRALKKLADISPQLLGMFLTGKKVHPMLQQEAKQLLLRSGAVPRKMVRQRM
jgi:tetratricopeptide (TPR) repeat protein